MTKKLTLTIDDKVIEFARAYASRTHQSISSIVEQYFERLESQADPGILSPEASSLYGVLQDSPVPDKTEMRTVFHGKNPD